MGRRKSINRENVLDAAEKIIAEKGSSALTIDAVAKAAGITKGGVQSCFGNKESLIEAMLMRYLTVYQQQVVSLTESESSGEANLAAHVAITEDLHDNNSSRAAALMAALLQSPQYLNSVRQWYRERFECTARLTGKEDDESKLIFFATEGLFFLRHFRLMEITDDEWEQYFNYIKTRLPG